MRPDGNAAAPGANTEGGEQIERGSEIKGKDIRPVKLDSDDLCPLVCSFSRSRCPWRCAPLKVRKLAS